MICPKERNNVEYCCTKTFKLFGLYGTSRIKMNNYLDFLFINFKYLRKTVKN